MAGFFAALRTLGVTTANTTADVVEGAGGILSAAARSSQLLTNTINMTLAEQRINHVAQTEKVRQTALEQLKLDISTELNSINQEYKNDGELLAIKTTLEADKDFTDFVKTFNDVVKDEVTAMRGNLAVNSTPK